MATKYLTGAAYDSAFRSNLARTGRALGRRVRVGRFSGS